MNELPVLHLECNAPFALPGVWKLMRLTSTGSVGWWGVMSALFSRHFVRGSDSFLLWLDSKSNIKKEEGKTYKKRQKKKKKKNNFNAHLIQHNRSHSHYLLSNSDWLVAQSVRKAKSEAKSRTVKLVTCIAYEHVSPSLSLIKGILCWDKLFCLEKCIKSK